ncbi:ABC transporter substrate-binding protein [Bradyrhizobium pachyrhizi]|uniref:ABC transporter substrate-binding protein n=1 Tax=Bradyrhizobium pachyrhizi TaxID=280333 RepID=A0A844SNN4_9BRAD|nr:ABC transporter substrate-binding protein [Bradyrhizobium pachyrhizi]MVT68618.1 ABC transporter substrate-binding protein [Bradyrhizobium pachyrhizi]WFU55777.1 ABC transporter substrate-binding protein [Bradyrhizobium pachyrhizi]
MSSTRFAVLVGAVLALAAVRPGHAQAQDVVRVGLVMPLTGVLGPVGKQAVAGARLYMAQHGDMVAGRKVELIVRDDASVPDNAKRIAQELIVNDEVAILGGGLTPSVLALAPLANESKTATVVMVSGTSIVTERSPYFVRSSWTHAQQASVLANWAARNGSKRATIIASDWAPGREAAGVFSASFTAAGGTIVEALKVPLANPDFAPFLQRARDGNPDTLFIFVPTSQAGILAKQFVERGLDKSGIKLIGPGDIADDEDLPGMSDAMIGMITAGFYSAAHPSDLNRDYVAAFRKANANVRPNFISVSAYDGMHLIYEALKVTGGKTNGDALVEAMKGMAWESPRGPMSIDPKTREVVHDIYIRKVEKVGGELYSVEQETFKTVKDPAKVANR